MSTLGRFDAARRDELARARRGVICLCRRVAELAELAESESRRVPEWSLAVAMLRAFACDLEDGHAEAVSLVESCWGDEPERWS